TRRPARRCRWRVCRPAPGSRLRRSLWPTEYPLRMRPAEVIISHQNTDFDALGSMLAARRLYPGAVVLAHGGPNRHVREFAALRAQELALADASRCDLDGVTRVVVVETSHLRRLGVLAELVERPGVETVLFDHHGEEPPPWVAPERYLSSSDGA